MTKMYVCYACESPTSNLVTTSIGTVLAACVNVDACQRRLDIAVRIYQDRTEKLYQEQTGQS